MSAKGFLVSCYQIELSSSGGLVTVVAHVSAGSVCAVYSAGETVTTDQTIVAVVTREGRKSTPRTDRVREKLVSSSVVAQGSPLDGASCGR